MNIKTNKASPGVTAKKIRILVFGIWDKDDAVSALRTVGPLSLLPPDEFDLTYVSTFKAVLTLPLVPDIIIVPRSPLSRMVRGRLARFARSMKIPVVADVDDLITDLPATHIKSAEYGAIREEIIQYWQDAQAITVTGRPLKEAIEKYNGNIRIFPNFIDERIWAGLTDSRVSRPADRDGRIVIGYAGSTSHEYDLKEVIPAIRAVLDKYKNKIIFKFIGYMPPSGQSIPGLEHIRPVSSYRKYADILAHGGFDIMLAPLEDNPFNRCKSDIKFLEYSICGYPGIYSNVGPYKDSVTDGETGILVGNSTAEWIAAMERLINDRQLRHTLAAKARKYIIEKRLLQSAAQERIEFYRALVSSGGGVRRSRISAAGVLAYGAYVVYDAVCKWAYFAGRIIR